MSIGALFPGQGSQRVGMGVALAEAYPAARATFDEASEALGFDLLDLCAEGPEERLRLTENTQPAILTVSMAAWRVWRERFGVEPVAAAGHSLGEFGALAAAGALSFADAVRLVRLRGKAMQEAVPVGRGAMAAILNLPLETVREVCREAARGQVVNPANLNAPGQIVISGHAEAVERAGAIAKARGARRILPLDVSAPFHCALMEPAARVLEAALADVEVHSLRFTVIANVDGAAYRSDGSDVRERLTAQVCAPVRWEDCVSAMAAAGMRRSVEFGAGKVVSALVKRILAEADTVTVEKPEDIEAFALS